jgi:hypothetical protein
MWSLPIRVSSLLAISYISIIYLVQIEMLPMRCSLKDQVEIMITSKMYQHDAIKRTFVALWLVVQLLCPLPSAEYV